MTEIQILEASQVNVDNYRSLRLEALKEEPQAFGSAYKDHVNLPIDEWQKWLNTYIEGKNSWMFFASYNGELVGMVGAYSTKNEEKDNQATKIIAMYVTKAARGKGISKLLMKKLLEKLSQQPSVKNFVLDVNVEQVAAVKLYERFGFNIIKKYTFVFGDEKEHEAYLMTKEL